MRYEVTRGSIHKRRHVICQEDQFYKVVPDDIRNRGAWQVIDRGDIDQLKPDFRHALEQDGWCYIEIYPVGFSPTIRP